MKYILIEAEKSFFIGLATNDYESIINNTDMIVMEKPLEFTFQTQLSLMPKNNPHDQDIYAPVVQYVAILESMPSIVTPNQRTFEGVSHSIIEVENPGENVLTGFHDATIKRLKTIESSLYNDPSSVRFTTDLEVDLRNKNRR